MFEISQVATTTLKSKMYNSFCNSETTEYIHMTISSVKNCNTSLGQNVRESRDKKKSSMDIKNSLTATAYNNISRSAGIPGM